MGMLFDLYLKCFEAVIFKHFTASPLRAGSLCASSSPGIVRNVRSLARLPDEANAALDRVKSVFSKQIGGREYVNVRVRLYLLVFVCVNWRARP